MCVFVVSASVGAGSFSKVSDRVWNELDKTNSELFKASQGHESYSVLSAAYAEFVKGAESKRKADTDE